MSILEKLNLLKNPSCKTSDCLNPECSFMKYAICCIKKVLMVSIIIIAMSPILIYYVLPKAMHNYILSNPNIIIESVQKFSETKQKEAQEGSAGKIKEIYAKDKTDSSIPFVGNKNGSHIALVYYDYSCSYCKKAASELKQLMKKDPQLKVVLKDLPLFGLPSIEAAKASMYVYAKHPDKFEEFHFRLIASKDISAKMINEISKSLGINENISKESKALYEEKIRDDYLQAGEIRIEGTPAIIINNKLSIGYKSADEIEKMFQ